MRSESTVAPLAVAAIASLISVVLTYAICRVLQKQMAPEPNPALVAAASAKIAMFWRLAIGGYVAAVVAIPAHALARHNLALAVRALGVVLPAAAAAILLQAALVP